MKAIGVRELKEHLVRYVRDVRGGEVVLVTDRGEVVAEMRPPGSPTRDPLAELAERGVLQLGSPVDPSIYRRLSRGLKRRLRAGTAKHLLDEERGDR